MNSKKKITDTLRSADKASVEKLIAEEAKKNEIFAKAAERAGKSADTGFADTVSGVERYDRRIRITRMASIAAAAVLCAGGILGSVHLMKNGDNRRTGEISAVSVEDLIGSSGETPYIPYDMIMDTDAFKLAFDSFTSPQNPLQLKNGTYEDAVAVKPYMSVVVDDDKVAGTHTVWHFPVVHEDTCLGFINYDTRYPDNLASAVYGGQQYADILNDAIRKGDIAVFVTTKGTYGIYEDNTVIKLEATEDYKGTITFDEVNKKYNLITQYYSDNIIYPPSKVTVTTAEAVTEAVTTAVVNAVEPVAVPVTTEPHDDVPDELTGEWLRERCLNATHYYDRFSADIYSFHAMYGYNLSDWESNGTVKIDNTAMNGEMYEEMSSPEREVWDRTYNILLNNIYVYTNQNDIAAQNQNDEGKHCRIESVDEYYKSESFKPDRPVLSDCLNFAGLGDKKVREDGIEDIKNETPWTITGERYENGRRIASISYSFEQLREGKYEPRYVTADIDAETGVCFAYETRTDHEYYGNGYLIESFRAANYKFDDEAEAPMTASEVREYLDSNGYEADEYSSDYKVENIG